jgi:hypothetical protein
MLLKNGCAPHLILLSMERKIGSDRRLDYGRTVTLYINTLVDVHSALGLDKFFMMHESA